LGVAAVGTSYTTWRLTSSSNRIALDSQSPGSVERRAPRAKLESEKVQSAAPPVTEPERTLTDPAISSPDATLPLPEPASVSSATDTSAGGQPEKSDSEGDEAAGAGGGGAFNPETGEINWDCPCLGGMAHGPCGPQFREAFSCFVFSEEEPKGINCVELFKNMQDCFREHPEVYADEIMDDDDDDVPAPAVTPVSGDSAPTAASENFEPSPAIPSSDAQPVPPVTSS
jgi:intermembrane space import and assembly protein 40